MRPGDKERKERGKAFLPDFLHSLGIQNIDKNFHCLLHKETSKVGSMKYYGPEQSQRAPYTVWCHGCNNGDGKPRDIYDLVGQLRGLSRAESFKWVFETYGVPESGAAGAERAVHTLPVASKPEPPGEPRADFKAFIDAAHGRIGDPAAVAYWQGKRGLSRAVVDRFRIGFDADWQNPVTAEKYPNIPASPRLIIPCDGDTGYLARDTRPELKDYDKQKVGVAGLFNAAALYQDKLAVAIVEGAINAMSIMDTGRAEAVAIGSTSGVDALLRLIDSKGKPLARTLIIAMDNDKAGEDAAGKLAAGLASREIPFYRLDVAALYGGANDANEALIADREEFGVRLTMAAVKADGAAADAEYDKRAEQIVKLAEYEELTGAGRMAAFEKALANPGKAIKTGFVGLDGDGKKKDGLLDGGLYAGLYIIGAIPALGKTTFVLQIADFIAAGGDDVLFFSLEMSAHELMARSISRLTAIDDGWGVDDEGHDLNNTEAHSARRIMKGVITNGIEGAKRTYKEKAGRLFIIEGAGDVGADEIRAKVARHIELTGHNPVVVVDYLQILKPPDDLARATDKQRTDYAVNRLKLISREHKTPVIAIASLNRENYSAKMSMESFKESGNIEYTCDVLMGLELRLDESVDDKKRKEAIDEASNNKEPLVNLVMLKNRSGVGYGVVGFQFIKPFSLFIENKPQAARRR
jgi:replicative DNA helicase